MKIASLSLNLGRLLLLVLLGGLFAEFSVCGKEAKLPPVLLAKFETAKDVKRWNVRRTLPKTIFELSTWPDNLPGQCVRVVYPEYKGKGEQWPAAILKDKSLMVKDWNTFEYLTFDVFSKVKANKILNICLISENKRRGFYKSIEIKPGMQTIAIPLSSFNMKYLGLIKELHLYLTRPEKEYEFFIGPIYLKPYVNLKEKAAKLVDELSLWSEKLKYSPPASFPESINQEWKSLAEASVHIVQTLKVLTDSKGTSLKNAIKTKKDIIKAEEVLQRILQINSISSMQSAFPGKAFGYGWLTSLEKVYRDNYHYKGSIGKSYVIELAKNEQEAVQLVLLPFKDLKNVRISLKALRNTAGEILPALSLKVAPVGYVYTEQPSYYAPRTGWQPDPIIEYQAVCSLEKYKWQSFWVEACIPKNQKAGVYPCIASISADGMPIIQVPFTVRVYDFALEKGSRLPLALSVFSYTSGRQVGQVYLSNDRDRDIFNKYIERKVAYDKIDSKVVKHAVAMKLKVEDLLMAHRLTADNIYRMIPPTVKEVKRAQSNGIKDFCIIKIEAGVKLQEGDAFPAKEKQRILKLLAKYIPEYKKAGVYDMGYIYGFDEASKNQYAAMRDIFGTIKNLYPDIKIMTTAYDNSFGKASGLDDMVDIWVPLTQKYVENRDKVDSARKRGHQVWWYVCCQPRPPYANWFIEQKSIGHRLLMGYMPYKYKSQGFLYYCLAMWRKYDKKDGKWKRSWRTKPMNGAPLTDWPGYSWRDTNGDGNIVYPGPDGPVASIRLKNIRDGLEDYIYLKMLEDAVKLVKSGKPAPDGSWLVNAEKCLKVNPQLLKSLTDYSSDGELLLKERRKMAQLLETWESFKRK